jgi:hypothetical protein
MTLFPPHPPCTRPLLRRTSCHGWSGSSRGAGELARPPVPGQDHALRHPGSRGGRQRRPALRCVVAATPLHARWRAPRLLGCSGMHAALGAPTADACRRAWCAGFDNGITGGVIAQPDFASRFFPVGGRRRMAPAAPPPPCCSAGGHTHRCCAVCWQGCCCHSAGSLA